MLIVISCGWGVQSFTTMAMSALRELPPVHAALHSDTTHERAATYKFAARWTPWLEERGVHVVTVRDESGATRIGDVDEYGGVFIPAFTNGSAGMLRRQCTNRWKIQPMRRWLNQELQRLGIKREPGVIEQWIGISFDEIQRMKQSDVQYITHRWPLTEKRMTRDDCVKWLVSHDLEVPVKSSCVFCPFHNRSAWRQMRDEGGADWEHAVAIDEAIRKSRPPFDLFVHRDHIPLSEVDMRTPQERGQLELFTQDECEGVCFL